jgi:20S proteasome subunit alpha 4
MGFDEGVTPKLYQTEPAGTYHEWKAAATGRSAKTVREYLEKNYSDDAVKTRDDTLILALRALLEVVQSGSKSIELAVMERGKTLEFIEADEIDKYMKRIESIKEDELKRKKARRDVPTAVPPSTRPEFASTSD